MFKDLKEEDFYKLKMVSKDRLSPDGIAVFLIGSFIFGAVATGVSWGIYKSDDYIHGSILESVLKTQFILMIISLLAAAFFSNTKNQFKFQRSQAVVLALISIRLSLDMSLFYFFACEDRHAPNYMTNLGLLFVIGGVVFLFISTLRGIHRVNAGMFRKGGKYLYNFSKSKIYISSPIAYSIILIGGTLSRILSGSNGSSFQIVELLFILILAVIIQYGLALVWPEFFLLAYCKNKFPTFICKMPERWLDYKQRGGK
ncbi:MAG: hypothetical protein Q8900_10735 [Bacillota bacterium]|nr:hypothetical protein [Bacillota bacterium]